VIQKCLSLICHSGLDPESRVFLAWIPAFAGMTVRNLCKEEC
jgi:hypothetical protein